MDAMTESFAQLFEESLKTVEMDVGSIISGVVIDIDGEWVTVHAGLKSEGMIPRSQFLDDDGKFHLEIGDEVQVALEAIEDGDGATRLSREKARRAETWKSLEGSFEGGEVVKGGGRSAGGVSPRSRRQSRQTLWRQDHAAYVRHQQGRCARLRWRDR